MKIKVFSRQDAIQESFIINENCVIISISNLNEERPIFAVNCSIKSVLSLWFDDEEDTKKGMNEEQADQIIEFINYWKDKVSLFIVHCGAGVSRSAGVAAALGKILNNDDTFIFNNPRYVPNRNCYRQVLNAFFKGENNE